MLTPDDPTKLPFHYFSASSFDLEHYLVIEISKALEEILASRRRLLDTPLSTGEGEYIRPIECDQVMDLTHHIREITTKLSRKLSSIDQAQEVSNNYYKLLMYLYSASEKSRNIDRLIQQFRPICMDSTSKQRTNFTKIQREVTTFARTCEKIEAETEGILDSILLKT
jgi:hypothetical protein